MNLNLLLVAAARPNFMKIAPLVKAIHAHNDKADRGGVIIHFKLVHTGQHYDEAMSRIFFTELGIPAPDINLEVGSGSHAVQTANILIRFESVCEKEKPDWVVVVGDVNSTMACTLVASKLGIRVAHVEAGLRSFDRAMPEEINRIVTDALADLLLTPSIDADENLKREGTPGHKIRLVGNVMIDALVANQVQARSSGILDRLDLKKKQFAYTTLHRPSNVDVRANLSATMTELIKLSSRMPVVFPMHPRTRKMLATFGIDPAAHGALRILDPVGYHDSLCLSENARLVVTDSGGLQEETTYFGVPCLTLRPNTERPVTVTIGSNKLTSLETLWKDIEEVLREDRPRGQVPPLWDGQTATRIVNALVEASFGLGSPSAQLN